MVLYIMGGIQGSVLVTIVLTVVCHAQNPELVIWPPQPTQQRSVGQSLVLSCMVRSPDQQLVSNIEWRDYNNRTVQPKVSHMTAPMTVEEITPSNSLSLFIPSINENMAGNYTCYATYANEPLVKSIRLEVFVGITWKNAPTEQYPTVGKDYIIACEVEASPSPTVSWLHNDEPIQSSQRYAVETKGLVIRNVQESDDGIYTCRAFVPFTGEVESRHIKVEVHVPPKMIDPDQNTFDFVEGEAAEIRCNATGKPKPTYTWIKQSTQENLNKANRFTVEEHTGILRINRVEQNDDSDYKCYAQNPAGTVEQTFKIHVLVKPKIYEFINVSQVENHQGKIICKATGRPAPNLTFRKFSNKEPFVPGIQSDSRIVLEISKDDQKGETSAKLLINPLYRSDDGLYECVASNTGATVYKNGHLTVEFAPTFPYNATQPSVWTWDNRPGNLSCFSQAIPNATIEWFLGGRPLVNSPTTKIVGNGPHSNLIVTPVQQNYYTKYKCLARNLHGVAEYSIELKQAFPPGIITQAMPEDVKATSIRFQITAPPTLGLPITAITVQYKPETEINWQFARNRTWSYESPYTVENLTPQKTYNFRFAAHNKVGMSQWSGEQTQTMPSRSVPEEPKILTNTLPNAQIMSSYADHYEVRWRIPADNGERIDLYDLKFCAVQKVNDNWNPINLETCEEKQFASIETTAYELNQLQSDTNYKIELRAHNAIGYSTPSIIIIKTARGPGDHHEVFRHEEPRLSSVLIVGIVLAAVFIILIIVDLSCFLVNRAGILMCICEHVRGKPVEDEEEAKLGRGEKEPLQPLDRNMGVIDNDMKRNTSIEFDGRRVISKTGEIIGKNSAV